MKVIKMETGWIIIEAEAVDWCCLPNTISYHREGDALILVLPTIPQVLFQGSCSDVADALLHHLIESRHAIGVQSFRIVLADSVLTPSTIPPPPPRAYKTDMMDVLVYASEEKVTSMKAAPLPDGNWVVHHGAFYIVKNLDEYVDEWRKKKIQAYQRHIEEKKAKLQGKTLDEILSSPELTSSLRDLLWWVERKEKMQLCYYTITRHLPSPLRSSYCIR